MPTANRTLLLHGAILVLLSLVEGLLVQNVTNPRMALSAHLGGLMSGTLLLAVGLAWPHLRLGGGTLRLTAWVLILSLYLLFLSNFAGAALGTSEATPIAGAGHSASRGQELLVTSGLMAGSAGSLVAFALLVWGLARRPRG